MTARKLALVLMLLFLGYCIYAFDLSSSQSSGNDAFSLPLSKSGFLRARIRFSRPPQQALTLLIMSEVTEAMAICKDGRVLLSYKEPIQKL